MCGILAVVGPASASARALMEDMRDSLAHRGPDDAGLHLEDGVALGHRRLSIIDLSAAGHQPMSNAEGTVWIVFNGEVYNYLEQRRELLARGRAFRSQTDTEVVLQLYEEYGEDCVHRLRGMFAFAIWDRRRQTLFAARDRLGKKPLYYAQVGHSLLLASEIKSLLRHPAVDSSAEPRALHLYLALQYVPSPLTAFKGIERLQAAHTLSWREGAVTRRRYWELEYGPKQFANENEAAEALETTLREAVRLRLRSDVPVGVLLSGGIDSSIVAALAAEHTTKLRTFTIGFRERGFDERAPARLVASHLGTEHQDLEASEDVVQLLPTLVRRFDQPFADPAALPTMLLSELTRRHVTVALNGDGGDEAFGGYERYRGASHWRAFRQLPRPLRQRWLWDHAATITGLVDARAGRLLRRAWDLGNESVQQHYARSMSHFSRESLSALFSERQRDLAAEWDPWQPLDEAFTEARRKGLGALDTLLFVDSQTYLPDCLLVKTDVASMAWGLELRSPLLDQKVFELAARLPEDVKVRGRQAKFLLKKIVRGRVPSEIVDRPKSGFGVPLGTWLRTSLRDVLRDTLLDGRLARRGYFRPESIQRLVDDHLVRGRDRAMMLWNLLVLETWHREVQEKRR